MVRREKMSLINLDEYILCVNENNEPMISGDGQVFLANAIDNSIIQCKVSPEIAHHYKLHQTTEEIINDEVPESSTSAVGLWSREAILNLLHLYKKHENHFKSTTIKRNKVWTMISTEMNNNGFKFTSLQCEHKFKYLKSRYIKKKENSGTKGTGESPFKFDFYDEFNEIFGDKPNITPPVLAGSLQLQQNEISKRCYDGDDIDDTDMLPKKNKKPKSKNEAADLLTYLKERHKKSDEEKQRRHEDRMETAQKTRDLYKEMMGKLIEKI